MNKIYLIIICLLFPVLVYAQNDSNTPPDVDGVWVFVSSSAVNSCDGSSTFSDTFVFDVSKDGFIDFPVTVTRVSNGRTLAGQASTLTVGTKLPGSGRADRFSGQEIENLIFGQRNTADRYDAANFQSSFDDCYI